MANVKPVSKIWVDGELVDWDEARLHTLTHTLHYGLGVFEGIRAYKTADGRVAVFRLRDHLQRLFDSAKIVGLPMRFSLEDLLVASHEILRANDLDEAYLRPIAFVGSGAMGLGAIENPTQTVVAAFRWGAYLGEEGLRKGIRARVSSFARHHVNTVLSKGKICGNYVNSILAKREALAGGYDEAIMLNTQGYVSEASGENLFLVRRGVLVTPPPGASILEGLTRDTIMVLAAEQGLEVVERNVTREELYIADELFMTGTAAEVTPVAEVDGRSVGTGRPGPTTRALQEAFWAVVRGQDPGRQSWLSYVE